MPTGIFQPPKLLMICCTSHIVSKMGKLLSFHFFGNIVSVFCLIAFYKIFCLWSTRDSFAGVVLASTRFRLQSQPYFCWYEERGVIGQVYNIMPILSEFVICSRSSVPRHYEIDI